MYVEGLLVLNRFIDDHTLHQAKHCVLDVALDNSEIFESLAPSFLQHFILHSSFSSLGLEINPQIANSTESSAFISINDVKYDKMKKNPMSGEILLQYEINLFFKFKLY